MVRRSKTLTEIVNQQREAAPMPAVRKEIRRLTPKTDLRRSQAESGKQPTWREALRG